MKKILKCFSVLLVLLTITPFVSSEASADPSRIDYYVYPGRIYPGQEDSGPYTLNLPNTSSKIYIKFNLKGYDVGFTVKRNGQIVDYGQIYPNANMNISRTFEEPGTYSLTLHCWDYANGCSGSGYILRAAGEPMLARIENDDETEFGVSSED